ncbi:hypothetical protein SAMN04489724_1135 [Algoriphagus locisalis]|uniref:Uncharacterized protein n=1 Tax=Algoriphagus locisalis TaxID=305507 RepID=A0A1I6YP77_9BACT|nr:hypothetical protein SAMN04489724_1135 [Algoriphagus locisalis]
MSKVATMENGGTKTLQPLYFTTVLNLNFPIFQFYNISILTK